MSFLIPSIASAGIGLLGSILGSSGKQDKGKFKQVPTMNPQQMAILQQLLGGVGGSLPSAFGHLQGILGNDPQTMEQFSAPYMRQFREQTIPELSTLFAGLGAGSSSGFQQALGQAGAGLEENLASLHGNLKNNAITQLQGLLGAGMQPSFENIFMKGQPTGLQRFGAGLSGMLPQGLQGLSTYYLLKNLMK